MQQSELKTELTRAFSRATGDLWQQIGLAEYPVGSYYISEDSTSPATLFGGTWVQIDGYAIVASSDANLVGTTTGSATHTLTVDEMPAHTHAGPSHTHTATTASAGGHTHTATTASAGGHTHTATTNSSGSHTHNFGTDTLQCRPISTKNSEALYKNSGSSVSGHVKSAGGHTHTLTTNSGGGCTHTLTTASSGAHTHTLTTASSGTADTGSAGGSQEFSLMQPSRYAYVWKRTA